jgi:ATP-dependent DNA helicase DinG
MDLIDDVRAILSPGGIVSKKLVGYEDRPQQIEMAEAVAEAFLDGGRLIVEAGTGVGKSFAYLIPAILFSSYADEPVVISTNTISLQEQLLDKDIPFLQEILPVDFTAVLVKGRGNYLCLRRLERIASSERGLFETRDEADEFNRIRRWAQSTSDGTLSDLIPNPSDSVWTMVCSESDNCLSSKCEFFKDCFYYKARARIFGANIIIVNHHLLFSDYVLRRENINAAVLPDYRHLIIDEAHNLESVATDHIGRNVSNWRVKRLLDGLYRPPRRGSEAGGLLARLEAVEHFPIVDRAREQSEIFFDLLSRWLSQADAKRIEVEGFLPNLVEEPLLTIEEALRGLRKSAEDESEEMEIRAFIRRCGELREDLDDILSLGTAGNVYWAERKGVGRRASGVGRSAGGRCSDLSLNAPRTSSNDQRTTHNAQRLTPYALRSTHLSLNTAPINLSDELNESFFLQLRTVIATSATLAVDGRFDFFKSRVGLDDARELIVGSPFDYRTQVTLYLHRDLPDPRDERFLDEAVLRIKAYLKMTHGKAFVLFTSYKMMDEAYERLAPYLEEMGVNALKQGDGLPRSEMLSLFRDDVNSVIFGTSSFWEGVDVQGEALSNVIIVKLPFSVPDHPIVQARLEEIERRGGNPFYEYSLPEAVLRLKQGFGRLIRTKADRGIVAILDPRILTKNYGRSFLNSLPRCKTVISGLTDRGVS